jgi:integrase
MVFQSQGGKTFKVRVEHPKTGDFATLTTGCRDRSDALDVERIVDGWRGKKGKKLERLDVIEALIKKWFTLPDAIDAHHAGELDALLARSQPKEPSVNLLAGDPQHPSWIDRWVRDKQSSGKGAGQAETYKKQVLALFPERPFTLDLFTRREVWARLDALECDSPTKNRYRTAASSLAKYLTKRELIDRNFVREIEGYGENDPRLVYYQMPDARTLVGGLAQPFAAIAALALGFCAEWGAIVRGRVGDFSLTTDPVTLRVRGTKRTWRDAVVPLVPELAWTLDFIRPALEGKLPAAPIVDDVPEWRAIRVQREVATTLELHAIGEEEYGPHSIHDWRHTHTVALLRWGYSEQIAAAHLRHKNTDLVRKVYGVFKPDQHDYAKGDSTKTTTSVTNHLKRGGAK